MSDTDITKFATINDLETRYSSNLTDYILISHRDNTDSNFASYKMQLNSMLGDVSAVIEKPLCCSILSNLKDLAWLNKDDLEDGEYLLTSYIRKVGWVSCFPENNDKQIVINQIQTNSDGLITNILCTDLDDYTTHISESIQYGGKIAILSASPKLSYDLYNGLSIHVHDNGDGTNEVSILNCGDPFYLGKTYNSNSNLLSTIITNISTVTDYGETIAVLTCNNHPLSIKNNINIQPVPYIDALSGNQVIAKINDSLSLYNNLCVENNKLTSNYGDKIARINGIDLSNGIVLGKALNNGINIISSINGMLLSSIEQYTPKSTFGTVIATFNGYDLSNGVSVSNCASNNEADGTNCNKIAEINGTNIYNGIKISQNTGSNISGSYNITTINNNGAEYKISSLTSDISVQCHTTEGNKVATIYNTKGKFDIYSGDISSYNETNKLQIVDIIYPVGSIYITVNKTAPEYLFHGTTWIRLNAGKCLVSIDDDTKLSSYDNGILPTLPSISVKTEISTLKFNIPALSTSDGGLHAHEISVTGTASNTPNHYHTAGTLKMEKAGAHTHSINVGAGSCSCSSKTSIGNSHIKANWTPPPETNSSGEHEHKFSGTTSEAGGHTHTISMRTILADAPAHKHKIDIPEFLHTVDSDDIKSTAGYVYNDIYNNRYADSNGTIRPDCFYVYMWLRTK